MPPPQIPDEGSIKRNDEWFNKNMCALEMNSVSAPTEQSYMSNISTIGRNFDPQIIKFDNFECMKSANKY